MEPYQHQRLSRPEDGSESIRLVRVRSGSPLDEIRVWIQEISLREATGPESRFWSALSYTWGNSEDIENIIVEMPDIASDGTVRSVQLKSLTVTRHLTEFLKRLKSSQKDSIMWIDAISIDQAGDAAALEERASQIKLMYQIYSQASGVIIWLGLEADDSDYAIQLLDELGSSFVVDWATLTFGTSTGQYSEPMTRWAHEYGELDRREFLAVWKLLGRKYFTRTWVRQEAMLANEESSVVRCGTRQVQLAKFRRALLFLGNIGFQSMALQRPEDADDRLTRAVNICQRTYMDVPNLMSRTRFTDCKDARDRVYGNLGMMSATGDLRLVDLINVYLQPHETPEKVYMDFFKRYYERYGTLRLLSEAGLCQGSDMRPTWVPDWRKRLIALELSMEAASSHFARAECNFLDDEVLQVLGVRASIVRRCQRLAIDDAHVVSMDWYWEILSIIRRFGLEIDQNIIAEQIAYALFCTLYNLPRELNLILGHRPGVLAYFQYLCSQRTTSASELQSPTQVVGPETAWALEQAIRYIKIYQLPIIVCEHRSLGIGPCGTQSGDVVTAILGSRPLVLLRPNDDNKFQVVGTCVVHGLNWGEALLGPLPDDYVVTPQLEPDRGAYMPHYHNTKTGETTMWDPRIAWAELQLEDIPQMASVEVIAAADGRPLRVRPDSKYLQRHGLILEKLSLI